MELNGKIIVISGAGGALGSALVARFVSEGAAALVLGDLDEAALDRAAVDHGTRESPILTRRTDVTAESEVDRLVDVALREFGRVDVLVNNAGILSPNGRIHNLGLDDWRRVIDVNLLGTVNGIRSAVRVMRPARAGAIINTGSISGVTAWAYTGPYGATKAAVIHLTKIAAVEYARDGIRVNCVCPGTFRSAILDELPDEALDAIGERHPLGLGTPDDIAGAFVYLASDSAPWTTGAALVVDGGYSAP